MKICEAVGLRPTDFQKRHNMTFGKPDEQPIDPYVSIDVDENHLGKSLGGRRSVVCPIHIQYFSAAANTRIRGRFIGVFIAPMLQ